MLANLHFILAVAAAALTDLAPAAVVNCTILLYWCDMMPAVPILMVAVNLVSKSLI